MIGWLIDCVFVRFTVPYLSNKEVVMLSGDWPVVFVDKPLQQQKVHCGLVSLWWCAHAKPVSVVWFVISKPVGCTERKKEQHRRRTTFCCMLGRKWEMIIQMLIWARKIQAVLRTFFVFPPAFSQAVSSSIVFFFLFFYKIRCELVSPVSQDSCLNAGRRSILSRFLSVELLLHWKKNDWRKSHANVTWHGVTQLAGAGSRSWSSSPRLLQWQFLN